jgi:molecular chaperone IbpA
MKGAKMNLPTGVFDPFRNLTVGFDNIFDQLSTLSSYDTSNYPPYNIKKVGKEKDTDTFVHRGIAQRSFKRQWTLAEHLEVTSAVLKDGVLKVDMKLNLPEEKKPKTITVK